MPRCEGYARHGDTFTMGWTQCENASVVMIRFMELEQERILPACAKCWQLCIDNKVDIVEVWPIAGAFAPPRKAPAKFDMKMQEHLQDMAAVMHLDLSFLDNGAKLLVQSMHTLELYCFLHDVLHFVELVEVRIDDKRLLNQYILVMVPKGKNET